MNKLHGLEIGKLVIDEDGDVGIIFKYDLNYTIFEEKEDIDVKKFYVYWSKKRTSSSYQIEKRTS